MNDFDDDGELELHLWAELNLPAELLQLTAVRPSPLARSLERAQSVAAFASGSDARREPDLDAEMPYPAGRLGLA